jgi:hypothetical protein
LSDKIRKGLRPPLPRNHLVGHTCNAFSAPGAKKSKAGCKEHSLVQ